MKSLTLKFSEEDELNLGKFVVSQNLATLNGNMDEKIKQKLEEMAKMESGILSICWIASCSKIKVPVDEKEYWIGRTSKTL